MRLDRNAGTAIPQHRLELQQELARRLELVGPIDIGAVAIDGVQPPLVPLVIGGIAPQRRAADGRRRLDHPGHAEKVIALADIADLRRLGRVVGVDLAQPHFEVEPELVGPLLHGTEKALVERRRDVEHGAEEHPGMAKLGTALEQLDRTELAGAGKLPPVDADADFGNFKSLCHDAGTGWAVGLVSSPMPPGTAAMSWRV